MEAKFKVKPKSKQTVKDGYYDNVELEAKGNGELLAEIIEFLRAEGFKID